MAEQARASGQEEWLRKPEVTRRRSHGGAFRQLLGACIVYLATVARRFAFT
ncbi:MAG: hypothetical protein NVSMB23_05770 [Myxococcales bacterium]